MPKNTIVDFDMDGEEMVTLEASISYDDVQIIQNSAGALSGNTFGGGSHLVSGSAVAGTTV